MKTQLILSKVRDISSCRTIKILNFISGYETSKKTN